MVIIEKNIENMKKKNGKKLYWMNEHYNVVPDC